jgi:hypothetical protein
LHVINRSRYITAPISGSVEFILTAVEGDRTRARQRVANIVDRSESYLVVTGSDATYLEIGQIYTINVARVPYDAIVLDPEDINIVVEPDNPRAFLEIVDEFPPELSQNVFINMRLTFEYVENALRIPYVMLKTAGERNFVFVMENGIRVARDVVVGLEGTNGVEILSGISEGEVVLR